MTKPVPPDDLWERLDAIEGRKDRPAGVFTAAEYAEKRDISPGRARDRLGQLVRAGKLTKVYFSPAGGGKTAGYSLVEEGK